MFNNNLTPNEEATGSTNAIGSGTILRGKLQTDGPIRIDGKIYGDVVTRSKIVLGKNSVVEGNIVAQSADIGGKVEGKVEIEDMLVLKPSCHIDGDIVTNMLVVESGAKLSGQCDIGMSGKNVERIERKNVPKPKQAQYEEIAKKEMTKTVGDGLTSKVDKIKSKLGV